METSSPTSEHESREERQIRIKSELQSMYREHFRREFSSGKKWAEVAVNWGEPDDPAYPEVLQQFREEVGGTAALMLAIQEVFDKFRGHRWQSDAAPEERKKAS